MRQELSELLYRRWPAIFAEYVGPEVDRKYQKIWCRDGWFDLIDTLCERLQEETDRRHAPQFVLFDAKEKFGALRFVGQDKSPEQKGILRMGNAMSLRICEECGAPGQHVVDGCTWMTRCEQHQPAGAITVAEYKELLENKRKRRESHVGKRYRCPACRRVHAAFPLAEAERQIAHWNEPLLANGEPPQAALTQYLACAVCGTAASQFVPASDADGELLGTLQGVVVPGAFD